MYSNLFKEEWRAIRFLADDDRSIFYQKKMIRVCVSWSGIEAEKQLSDPSVYRDVSNGENILLKLSKASNCSLV